jgi:hypothetical protein
MVEPRVDSSDSSSDKRVASSPPSVPPSPSPAVLVPPPWPVASRPPPEPAPPFERDELVSAVARPHRVFDLVLAAPARLATNIVDRRHLPELLLALFLASTLFSIPYACVLGGPSWSSYWWRIGVLYLGSTLICFPALHVFCTYMGVRVKIMQDLTLALTIPAVAALFTFGFAPILGFLLWTVKDSEQGIGYRGLSGFLLGLAVLAGIGQMWRCLSRARELSIDVLHVFVLCGWNCVFLYVLFRMGQVLGLGA